MSPDKITIKGVSQGILVQLGDGDWRERLSALEARLGESIAFFRGGRVALDVGPRQLAVSDIEEVRSLLTRHDVKLIAVLSPNPATEASAQQLKLVIRIDPPRSRDAGHAAARGKAPLGEGWLVRGTLRSGQVLRHPGHIVIIGDVNPGGEVVAGGDVVVWGKLRGVVHAGALGQESAVVCALDLSPSQLRIGDHVARSPQDERRRPVPETASLKDGRIVALPWQG